MNAITTRMITALAAPAFAAGILAGGAALATAAPVVAQTCTTTGNAYVTPNSVNPLTRPAQVNAVQATTQVWAAPSTCLGH